jgi:hypothetical protein
MTTDDATPPTAAQGKGLTPVDNVRPIRPPFGGDWPHHEQLSLAADYLRISLGRIKVAVYALRGIAAQDERIDGDQLDPIAALLIDDVHNDIDIAREIFATWKAQESKDGGS